MILHTFGVQVHPKHPQPSAWICLAVVQPWLYFTKFRGWEGVTHRRLLQSFYAETGRIYPKP